MKAKQLAEGLLMVRQGSAEDKEHAARLFLAATDDDPLRQYACVVLRGLLEAEGHLIDDLMNSSICWMSI
jgi:hypothetical protein